VTTANTAFPWLLLPAPASGLWRAAVTIEQEVAEGALLGTLTDPLGEAIGESPPRSMG
jgi:predicted deacylase